MSRAFVYRRMLISYFPTHPKPDGSPFTKKIALAVDFCNLKITSQGLGQGRLGIRVMFRYGLGCTYSRSDKRSTSHFLRARVGFRVRIRARIDLRIRTPVLARGRGP